LTDTRRTFFFSRSFARSFTRAFPAAFLSAFLVAACAPALKPLPPKTEPGLALKPVSFNDLPGWKDGNQGAALGPLLKTCPLLNSGKSARDWRAVCDTAGRLERGDTAARQFFETRFTPHLATSKNGKDDGLFTGYFEATLRGSLKRSKRYWVPVYGPPQDLVSANLGDFDPEWKGRQIAGRIEGGRLRPYDSRARIDAGALDGRGLEVVWADDPVDVFFLHVQGSGRVIMDDGRTLRLGFAGRNGHAYKSIGYELVKMGVMEKDRVSMRSIRAWIKANPERGRALMASNPSYIFFRTLKHATDEGPVGSAGVALTPGRSLAVDRRFIPLGQPLWLDTTDPLDAAKPLRRMVIAQDTGAAIRGAVRGDLFWGFGETAARRAGAMKSRGRYYLLLPKGVTP